ncbi:MAG: hypothetical protein IKU67_03760, partial [Firmicutes bacterium]|nr:hypothetical protein [Bacillota bacterium]
MKTNSKRKFLCVLLSMLLVVAMVPATAFADTAPLNTIEINLTKQPSFGTSRTYTDELAGDILSSFSIDEDAPYEITQRSIGTGMWRTDRVWNGETIDLEKEYWVYLLVESKFVGDERPDIFTDNVAISFDGVTPITSDVEQYFNFSVEVYVKIDTSQIPTTQPQIDPITVELEDAPTFTAGMTLDEINAYSPEDYANAEADGVEDVTYTWMVKVDESFKVDGATWFNNMIDVVMNNYGGWMALNDDYFYYRDLVGNEEFGIKIDLTRSEGRHFDKNNRNRYLGTVNDGDAEVAFDRVTPGMDALSLYYSVGTVAEAPKEKIDSFGVQVDWSKIPTLKEGMTIENFIPEKNDGIGDACFAESPVSVVTGPVECENNYGWAIQLDNSFLIDDEEAVEIYDKLGNTQEVFENIADYNRNVSEAMDMFSGWCPLEMFLSAANKLGFYEINENDTYALWMGVETVGDNKVFADPDDEGNYPGKIDCNVEVGSVIYNYDDYLLLFFKLGTLSEMEDEKNGSSYPVDGVVPSLGEDSIKVEGNVVKFDVPANDDEYFYVKVVMPQSNLEGTGLTLEAYRDMINSAEGKDILDVKALGDTLEELAPYSASGQLYGISTP